MDHWTIQNTFSDFNSAIRNHEVDDVRRLLRTRKFPINGNVPYGDPPIITCIRSCRKKEDEPKTLEILKLLVQHGADVNVRSRMDSTVGMTAAMIAAAKGLESCLRFLVESGTDLTLRAEYDVDDFEAESEYCENNNGQTALMLAASRSDNAHSLCVKCLVEAGVDLNVLDKFENTALMYASGGGNVESVKFLTDGMSVSTLNQANVGGKTALMLAALRQSTDNVDILKYLVEAGADVNFQCKRGYTALMYASESGNVESVKLLTERMSVSTLDQVNGEGETALMLAASRYKMDNADILKYLVEVGADVNVQCKDGYTALMCAMDSLNVESVKLLTERMSVSTLDKVNDYGQTALMMAASRCTDNADILKYLVEARADVNIQCKRGYTALMYASESGNVESVKFLTERMSVSTLDKVNDYGQTALMMAASRCTDNADILKYLVEARADVNIQCKRGYTALMYASESGNVESVKFLTERMSVSTLNQVNDKGQTALMLAATRNAYLYDDKDADILKYLVEAGPDMNIQCKRGYTALMYATESGNVESVKLLTERMSVSTLDKVNGEGQTALMLAASRCTDNADILKYLVEAGADVNIQCKDGYTALLYALERGKVEMVKLLTERMSVSTLNQVNDKGQTALMLVASRCTDNADILKYLVEAGADMNIQCKRGYTALKEASRYVSRDDHLQHLITAGADLNVTHTETGYTALMIALDRGNDSAVSLLLEKGALVNIVTPDLKTPLSLHPGRNNVMNTKLLSHGLDPALSYRDQKILHTMVVKGEKSLVRGLVMNGFPPVDVECDDFKFTGSPQLFNWYLLREYGTPMSPLALALASKRHDIARYLIVNRFFTRYDLVQLCRDKKFRQYIQRKPQCLEILDFLSARPHSLHDLCLVTVSSALSQYLVHDPLDIPPGDSRWMCKPTFRERVDLLQLPPRLKRELLHQTLSSSISCESWGDIPLE